VFPSEVAPYEVVIVPVLSGTSGPSVLAFARELAEELRRAGRRVVLDDGDERPGAKYYRWELAGVPLRLEVGPREVGSGHITSVDRLGRKAPLDRKNLLADAAGRLSDFDRELARRAEASFRASITPAERLEQLTGSESVRLVGWCGAEECGHAIERAVDGALLGTPEEPLPFPVAPPTSCIACGSPEGVRLALAAQPM